MTKAELVEEVAKVSEVTKKHSEVIVNTVFQSIIEALHGDEKIELRGFGSFRVRQRRSRQPLFKTFDSIHRRGENSLRSRIQQNLGRDFGPSLCR